MILPHQNLRWHIPRRPTSLMCILRSPVPRNSQICHPTVPFLIKNYILRLQISMNYVFWMQIRQSFHNATHDKLFRIGYKNYLFVPRWNGTVYLSSIAGHLSPGSPSTSINFICLERKVSCWLWTCARQVTAYSAVISRSSLSSRCAWWSTVLCQSL